jgi:hypothetical protein
LLLCIEELFFIGRRCVMKNFLNQMWVKVVAVIFIILGAGVLLYDGVSVNELSDLIKLVAGVLTSIGLLIAGAIALVNKLKKNK